MLCHHIARSTKRLSALQQTKRSSDCCNRCFRRMRGNARARETPTSMHLSQSCDGYEKVLEAFQRRDPHLAEREIRRQIRGCIRGDSPVLLPRNSPLAPRSPQKSSSPIESSDEAFTGIGFTRLMRSMLSLELAIVVALIVLNGLLAMAELAVVSSRPRAPAGADRSRGHRREARAGACRRSGKVSLDRADRHHAGRRALRRVFGRDARLRLGE